MRLIEQHKRIGQRAITIIGIGCLVILIVGETGNRAVQCCRAIIVQAEGVAARQVDDIRSARGDGKTLRGRTDKARTCRQRGSHTERQHHQAQRSEPLPETAS
ncbi:hypothetical protein D3C72_1573300 [compost metagenome]